MATEPIFWFWLSKELLETSKLENTTLAIPLQTEHLLLWHGDSFYYENWVDSGKE